MPSQCVCWHSFEFGRYCYQCNIMAEGFRFMPLGLVRLRTFRFSAWVTEVQHERRCSRACGWVDVSFRDVKIKIPDRGMWMTSCTGSERGGFWGVWKKSVSWELDSEREGSTFGARWDQTNLCATGKVIIERLCISLPYVKTFNSKVIKGFVPELRSRYVFFVFRDSYVLCIYVMNILCTFHTYSCMAMLH